MHWSECMEYTVFHFGPWLRVQWSEGAIVWYADWRRLLCECQYKTGTVTKPIPQRIFAADFAMSLIAIFCLFVASHSVFRMDASRMNTRYHAHFECLDFICWTFTKRDFEYDSFRWMTASCFMKDWRVRWRREQLLFRWRRRLHRRHRKGQPPPHWGSMMNRNRKETVYCARWPPSRSNELDTYYHCDGVGMEYGAVDIRRVVEWMCHNGHRS